MTAREPGARRRHAMPFGATSAPDGSTRFRLWAPAAREVAVVLPDAQAAREVPLDATGGGWYERRVASAPAGTRYLYRIDGGLTVPDPASRFNPEDVHGPSVVVDPRAFEWPDGDWRGRPWEETVIYELHVGTFSSAGTFAGVASQLDRLADLGVTALELMPVADFPGRRNWGYDGVLPFAPDAAYGTPEDLKRLVAAAHARGLMVFLDVVYNHFGPEGNYLHAYAPAFFTTRHRTPWGAAIDFESPAARTVRDFFIHNALFWLEEYHCDGLRLDAVHAIVDASEPDIVTELAQAVRAGPGATRHVHLVLENDHNEAAYLRRDRAGRASIASAQWNDDVHHALHVLTTGERDGYYEDYADEPVRWLGRALAEGFGFQGDASGYRGGARRGSPSAHLPATAFVNFLQTHDQVGNRAFGERIAALAPVEAVAAASAVLLLAPSIPLLFMGEEFASASPFLFFCDFEPGLAAAVRDGRRAEFGRFERFRDAAVREAIPDPNDPATFALSRIEPARELTAVQREVLAFHRALLRTRREHVVPRLAGMQPGGHFRGEGSHLAVEWTLGDGSVLALGANLGARARPARAPLTGHRLHASAGLRTIAGEVDVLPPWSVVWTLRAEPAPA